MRATFEFVEPFDLLLDIAGRKFPCSLELVSSETGVVLLDESVAVGGVDIGPIEVRPRYEHSFLSDVSDGGSVDVNAASNGVYLIAVICPVSEDPARC